ncbi:ATP-grasp domain-containing protein [Candidatus Gottesmanbacteria bacterium]|nr:ATP-grasp domain-containing protein [Candidatus Gottesmanbacteria bacterium]
MKKAKKLRTKYTIALLYHYLSKEEQKQYFSREHVITDTQMQTDEIVSYMRALFRRRGYRAQTIKVEEKNLSNLKKLTDVDFVFNLVDSKALEIQIARILDRLKIPHSGSSLEAIRTTNNKLHSKQLFEKHSLPTPSYTTIRRTDRITRNLVPGKFPVIIKPAFEHCSIGITDHSIVQNYAQFKRTVKRLRDKHRQTLLVEAFIPGKELQVTVLETPDKTLALPIAEIVFPRKESKWNIYGFKEKWTKHFDTCLFVAPPKRLADTITTQIKREAIRAFYALGLRDYARFDLRFNPKIRRWYFLEANANAGFDPDPRDAMTASIRAHGMTLDDFVLQIVKNSLN